MPLGMWEMQIKTHCDVTIHLLEWLKLRSLTLISSVGKDIEKLKLIYTLVGIITSLKTTFGIFFKN